VVDVSVCPATKYLCSLGYPEGSLLYILHTKYHRALAIKYAQCIAAPKDNDWREAEEAQNNLLAAILVEYRQAEEKAILNNQSQPEPVLSSSSEQSLQLQG
jgi:hypothetical protein